MQALAPGATTHRYQGVSKLRAWRLGLGLSLDDLAGLTGLSEGHLSKIETGKTNVPPLTRVRIAKRLGARVAELFEPEPFEADADAV